MTDPKPTTSAPSLGRALADALGGQLVETHISWVVLTADAAYKIKKPVHLPFVDYSNLEARRHCCEEEVRLNRRLAPSLYLGVRQVTGARDHPSLDGGGAILDYAVHMRRLPDGSLFSEKLMAGELRAHEVDSLATLIGTFHLHAPSAGARGAFGTPAVRAAAATAALSGIAGFATEAERKTLAHWIEEAAAKLAPLWKQRLLGGWVRECHGDLHLDNAAWYAGAAIAFDGVEFDPALRWIDVLDDAAFMVMDFVAHGRADFAFRFLNKWLDITGNHEALGALAFSFLYRALVRAHVAWLRDDRIAARRYLDTALNCLRPRAPRLVITFGLPGSGKTFQSQNFLETDGAIRVRSDVERKRLFGLGMLDDSRDRGLDVYRTDASEATYARLCDLAAVILAAGYAVILDAAFLKRSERERAAAVARHAGVPFHIFACEAPLPLLRERLLTRRGDASEATPAVLEYLVHAAEPLEDHEKSVVMPAK